MIMEGSSTSTGSSRRVALIACAAAGAAGYVWLRSRARAPRGGGYATDFESFLVAPVPSAAPAAPLSSSKKQQHAATAFESFLKVAPVQEQPAATDFASFLIDRRTMAGGAAAGADAQAAAAAAAAEPAEPVPEGSVPVAVLYGTEYGFAREIGEKLAASLKATGRLWPLLDNAAHHPAGYDFSKLQAALLVFSTQGDGVPPTDARRFCDWLAAAAPGQLGHLSYSVCALGDSAYTHFCRCGRALDAALAGAGAAPLLPRADVDKEDWRVVDGWIEGAVAALLQQADSLRSFADLGGVAASGLVAGAGAAAAAAAAAHASSGYSKSVPYYARVVSVEGLCVLSSADDKDTVRLQLALEGGGEGGLRYAPGDALGIWPTNPPQAVDDLLAALGASGDEAVPTPAWHYREQPAPAGPTTSLRHALSVAYDIKSPKAKPLLAALQAPLQAALAAAAADAPPPAAAPPPPAAGAKGGARASIELQVDATAAGGAGRAHGTSAGADAGAAGDQAGGGAAETQSQLSPLAASAAAVDALLAADAAALERYLAPRHVADMLEEASGGGAVRLAPAVLLGALRPLAPRLYSISSSPLEYSPANSGVAATIAVVRYTSLGRARRGVASTHVGERLSPGQALPVFISPNPDFRLPRAPTTPLIMVGPGTGLAPFRAFILQRLLERSSNQTQTQQQQQEGGASSAGQSPTAAAPAAAPGPMHLFFGCRRRDQDFLYGQQLTAWHECGAIRLHTAFSREGAHKVYVQQRLREAGAEVWALLQAGAHFYVCGDAGSMAGAVEAVLLDIIAAHLPAAGADGGGSEGGSSEASKAAAAAAYLEQLSASERYQRDVWFS